METIVNVENLSKEFDNSTVLDDINLKVEKGEFLAIMGQSGSGKSTLLYNISGMDRPTVGKVEFCGQEISTLTDDELSNLRLKKMGFVFQQPYLLKNLSIKDNIVLPGFKSGILSRQQVNDTADSLMKKTGILDVAAHGITKVSGGQLQRASICRALINQPEVLFGDEPTGALNSTTTREVMDIINQINQEGTTVILVTHDAKVAARADRVIFLVDGKVHSEYKMSRYQKGGDSVVREKELADWLEKEGF